jgi:hypothetical protein
MASEAMPAGAEEARHLAETQAAGEAMSLEQTRTAETSMHVAETQTAEEDMQAEETAMAAPTAAAAILSGEFVKGEVSVMGGYTLDPATGTLTFRDDFGVVTGPDLYVILSGAEDLSVDYRTLSQMVVNSAKLTLAPLAQTTGAQTYRVPAGTDLSQYKTVVIWCESFSVAFAAAPLAAE